MAEAMRARLMADTSMFPAGLPPPTDRRFGDRGYPVGSTFESRESLRKAGMHGPTVAGIWGSVDLGAFSVIVSGGYADDRDEGDFIEYTGTGGQGDSYGARGEQIYDQSWEHKDNRSLQRSVETQRPIRVIRGKAEGSKYAPEFGYRFDGMYIVEKAFSAKGVHGFLVCKFHLRRLPGQPPVPTLR
ncbi:PUA-like domain-containing protein [Lyophyllum atratum]|nr:PUA-like domain-containing protein [Lyophyllum atratum]